MFWTLGQWSTPLNHGGFSEADPIQVKVECHPWIWDKGHGEYFNRTRHEEAWHEIAVALFDNFDQMSSSIQNEILKDIRNQWKSASDYFVKGIKKAEKSGSAGGKRKKIPYEDQLQFLRPNRVLRPTSGNFQAPSNTQQDADEEPRSEPVRSDTPLESEAPGPSNPLEDFDQHLDVEEDVSNLSTDQPPSSTPTPAAGEIEEMEEATNIPSSQTTTRPPTA
ncbi:uncharacterized protein LOC130358859 [Hyla sarda]|uniref:uncharacterized protein LOC130358859 n=1 Tax=Hyla sarda TaxID=327740 RepID=UPI0024C392B9|nr:uncharacterized protein LOC130358859 [Hyla sarda]